jgi:hypothetical protein
MADLPKLPKRPNYFQAQFLVVRDFEDEQSYHREMLNRHNRNLHEWGVVRDGLAVTRTGDNQNLSISPGSAIDSLGREIVLETAQLLSMDKVRAASQATGPMQDVSITIAFRETDSTAPEDKYPGTDSVTRQAQSPIIDATKTPATDGTVITLARISVANNDVAQPNNAVRKLASSFIARGSNLGDISLDGALSFTSKSSPNPTSPQVGQDYDSVSDALRIRARTKDAPALDATHLSIKRETGNVGIGMPPAAARFSIQAAPYTGTLMDFVIGDIYRLTLGYSAFENDTVSYYYDLTNNLGNKFEKFLVFHKGNVGIGADKPTHQLTIENKTAAASLRLKSSVDGGDYGLLIGSSKTGAYLATAQSLGLQSGATGIKLLAAGNIGIGTGNADPTERLDVRSSGPDVAMNLRVANSDVTSFLSLYPGKTGDLNPTIMWPTDKVLRFSTANKIDNGVADGLVERFRITGDGKVGIATTNLRRRFQIGDVLGFEPSDVSPNAGFIRFGDSTGWKLHFCQSSSGGTLLTSTTGAIMTLVDKGNVGIGTTNPLGPLSIGDSSVDGSDGYVVIGKKSGGDTRHFRIGFDSNFRFIIGDYGNSNVAGTWLSPFAMDWGAPSNCLFIKSNGNVGIGTANPTKAKLEVSGYVNTEVDGYGYTNRNGASAVNGKITSSYSIWASNRIAGVEFNAFSDERIKNIRGRSDGAIDLQTLLGIEIADYIFKDVITKGSTPHKKVIGQQVEKVFPQAVSKLTDVVPDIYRQASFADGWTALSADLKKGERVRLISDKAEGVYEVLEVTPDKFRTDFKPEGDRVFVFGREVSDFRTVDYDAIAMLNVSATQQLKKEKDEEVKALQAENRELKARLDALEAAIQRLLLSVGTPAARTDSTSVGATSI